MKLFLGIIIGALLASGVFYYFSKIKKEKEAAEFIASVDSAKAVNMNFNEPAKDTGGGNIIITKNALTIIASGNNELYYYHGADCTKLEKSDFKSLRNLLAAEKKKSNANNLMIIIKAAPESTYKNAIDILDEITINKIPVGHYVETEITKEEIEGINILKKTKNG